MAVGLPPVAGNRIQAVTIASIAPLAVIKPTDQPVTSSTTLVNDNALALPLVTASATYLFTCYLNFEGGTQGASDIKIEWLVPAGATLRFVPLYDNLTPAASLATTKADTTVISMSTNGAGVLQGATMFGTLVMGTTTGTLQLKWAQNTSSGTSTIVHAQSYVSLWRIT